MYYKQNEPILKQIVKYVHKQLHYAAQYLVKGKSFGMQKIAQEHNCIRPSGGLYVNPMIWISFLTVL